MNWDNYPRSKKFLEEHPEMTLDDALIFTEKEINRRGGYASSESC